MAEVKTSKLLEISGAPGMDDVNALAIWSEDIILDPGNVRYPIRVVLVDDHFRTRFDRLVKLPENSKTYIYRVLDHGIPWQHLSAGLTIDEIKERVVTLAKGKALVMYDAWKTIGLFNFDKTELSGFQIYDLKAYRESKGPNGVSVTFWDLVREKLGHVYTGKPGHYDTLELTDFVMSIYLKYTKEDEIPEGNNAVLQNDTPESKPTTVSQN